MSVPETTTIQREVWTYRDADWELLQCRLEDEDWNFLREANPDAGAEQLTKVIMDHAHTVIGKRTLHEKKQLTPGSQRRV